MADIEPWGLWHSKALAAGVGAALMSLGRSVIRDYWQHGRDHAALTGEGAYAGLGADRHHAMMIAMARQKPDLASACFAAALAGVVSACVRAGWLCVGAGLTVGQIVRLSYGGDPIEAMPAGAKK